MKRGLPDDVDAACDVGDDDEEELPEGASAVRIVFDFLRPCYQGQRGPLILLGLCVLAETLYNVAFPLSLKYLIDDALLKQDRSALVWILIVLGILAVVISAVTMAMEFLNARLAATVVRDVRHRLFAHMQSLSLAFYSTTTAGDVVSRFSTDLAEVEETARGWVGMALIPALEILAATLLLFYLSWQLALTVMLIWPLTMIGPKLLSKRTVAATYRKKELEASTLAMVQENVAAQPVIQVFGLRGIAQAWFRKRSLPLAHTSARVNFLTAMAERSVSTAVLLLHLLILGFGAWLAFGKQITIGTLVTFESVFWELSYNIGFIGEFIPEVMESAGAVQHMNDLLDEESGVEDKPGAVALPRMQREISFENVSFSYTGAQSQLKNLNLRIPAGAKVGIVGPSGSGKSTILSLILRLYDPTRGRVRIDGQDLRDVTRETLWAQIGVVFQESFLFNTTIRENIRLGKQDASDAEVEAAAKAAEIHEFIQTLPQGYETNAGERGNLMSGGQRQRIAIARAIIRNPAVLILDEATSALDPATESAILSTLYRLAAGRTMIFATHRVALLAEADTVFLLKKGKVAASGSPRDMLPPTAG
jgi:ATP-binding cassette subfamily B protein